MALLAPELAALLVALVLGAAVLDVRSGRIRNGWLLLIAGLGLLARSVSGPSAQALGWGLAGIATGLMVWIGPFALRWVGAADVKLVAAVGAWLGPLGVFRASLFAGVAGGLMGLGYLAVTRRREALEVVQVQLLSLRTTRRLVSGPTSVGPVETSHGMPYAVAILAGVTFELFVAGALSF